jgi:hypothetical protein
VQYLHGKLQNLHPLRPQTMQNLHPFRGIKRSGGAKNGRFFEWTGNGVTHHLVLPLKLKNDSRKPST